MPGGNANINELMSTTLQKWLEKNFIDNVFKARVLAWTLMKNDNIRKVDGGEKVTVPLMEGTNGTVMPFSHDEELRILRQKGLTRAVYDWSQIAASITITGLEEGINAGESKVISLLETKTEQAEESMRDYFNKMFFGSAADPFNQSLLDPSVAWNGLEDFLDASNLTVGGVTGTANDEQITGHDTEQVATKSGNIGASYPTAEAGVPGTADPGHGVRKGGFWLPTTGNVVAPTAGATGAVDMVAGKRLMRRVYNSASIGNDQPQLILTTQDLFESYEDSLVDQIRYTSTEMADAGFQNLMFKGAPVTYDADAKAGNMDFLNFRYLRLVGHSDTWFRNTPFVKPANRDTRTAQILCYGQFVTLKRAAQGRLAFAAKA